MAAAAGAASRQPFTCFVTPLPPSGASRRIGPGRATVPVPQVLPCVLIGFLFGGPLIGAMVGAGISWILGRRIDIGIDNDFIERVSSELTPGDSALLLLVKDTPVETLTETLNAQGGRLYHTSLSDEAAAAFTQASESPDVERALARESGS